MNLDLKNKNAMICGATAGIGKATAMQLAAMGASITLVARNKQKLKATLALLPSQDNQTHSYLVADFTNPSTIERASNCGCLKNKLSYFIKQYGRPKRRTYF